MVERIVKNKKVSKCYRCGNPITTDYKVRWKVDEGEKKGRYYHLTCYNKMVLYSIRRNKEEIKELNKSKRKLKKYSRYIILENLQ